jgi:molybdenum cofactor synthesis domain-containing protein
MSTTTTQSQTTPPSAALMIIGNEVLSGSIADANTPWLAKLLYSRGVDLIRVEVIPDDPEDIAATVLKLRDRVGPTGFVFTSGGIGPTHDDVTYDSIAMALGLKVELHQPTVELMKKHYAARGVELVRSSYFSTYSDLLIAEAILAMR